MLLTDGCGTAFGLHVDSANPHEVTLIEPLSERSVVPLPPRARLLYDRAADSGRLRFRLTWKNIRLIAPFRSYAGRKPRRLRRPDRTLYTLCRWKIERSIAWLKNFRRLQSRHEYHPQNYNGFWIIGIVFTILKRF